MLCVCHAQVATTTWLESIGQYNITLDYDGRRRRREGPGIDPWWTQETNVADEKHI